MKEDIINKLKKRLDSLYIERDNAPDAHTERHLTGVIAGVNLSLDEIRTIKE